MSSSVYSGQVSSFPLYTSLLRRRDKVNWMCSSIVFYPLDCFLNKLFSTLVTGDNVQMKPSLRFNDK